MARKYYTLVEFRDGRWTPEFGDFDKETVAQERRDRLDSYDALKASQIKVISSGAAQAEIDAAVAKLNQKG